MTCREAMPMKEPAGASYIVPDLTRQRCRTGKAALRAQAREQTHRHEPFDERSRKSYEMRFTHQRPGTERRAHADVHDAMPPARPNDVMDHHDIDAGWGHDASAQGDVGRWKAKTVSATKPANHSTVQRGRTAKQSRGLRQVTLRQ